MLRPLLSRLSVALTPSRASPRACLLVAMISMNFPCRASVTSKPCWPSVRRFFAVAFTL
jgi:hypothetical protein